MPPRPKRAPGRLRAAFVALTTLAILAPAAAAPRPAPPQVEIRRTTDGIPHVRARDWRGLGAGIGYVQAQDALCTLADAFVTFAGRRSLFFGPDARPAHDSSFGRPTNLEADFFFRGIVADDLVRRFEAAQPPELRALIAGYADGYDRYLHEPRHAAGASGAVARRACAGEPWVRDIGADDVIRRLLAVQLAAGYAHFIPEIAGAAPPAGDAATAAAAASDDRTLAARLAHPLGTQPALGSNMMAFGDAATGGDGAVLLGNPHWYWGGADRFYQMHLTIPGRIDVAGVALLGVPVVMIGFNADVAWSHTVSTARRFGLFDLALDPADPTRYLVDGAPVSMQARQVTVETRAGPVTRTLYRSAEGPLIDLRAQDAALGWNRAHALAIRDVNAGNFDLFRNFLDWDRARSLDEFIAIQRREAAMPWVNTLAIGRGDGRAWYSAIGAVPAVSDALRERCATPIARAFAQADAATPVLDGSRRDCTWPDLADARLPGTWPASALPALLRRDELANMNDSHRLANPAQPLDGFPAVLGDEAGPLSLRARLGHDLARAMARRGFASSAALAEALREDALATRSYPALHFRASVVARACDAAGASAAPELAGGCAVLRAWSGAAEADTRGALLWDAFWLELQKSPAGTLYRIPFDSNAPIDTPADVRPDPARAREALVAAVAALHARGLDVDAAVGARVRVRDGDGFLPLSGGCAEAGHFAVVCPEDGADALGPDTVGNSYLQVVRFGHGGVDARTLLAHGLDEDAATGGAGMAPVRRYARKAWLNFPFAERDIARDPGLTRIVLPAPALAETPAPARAD